MIFIRKNVSETSRVHFSFQKDLTILEHSNNLVFINTDKDSYSEKMYHIHKF